MSRRSYSRHIPDFRLVTFFAETNDSPVHRMNPWTKAFMLLILVALVTVLTDPVPLFVLFIASLGFYALAGLPLRVLVGWWTLPVMFVLTLSVLFAFTEPGDKVSELSLLGWSVSLTDNGLMLILKLLLRALAVVNYSLALFMTTKYVHIAYIAFRTLPGTLANMFLLSYRFMFETSDEISDVLDALHARNGSLARGVARQTRMFAGIVGLSFVHAFERAERIAKAMEARGFTGEFPIVEKVERPSAKGLALLTSAAAVLAIAAYSRYFSGNLTGWW
ncbi:MAG: cobalt ECF transporter T component CbiQ [Euryarchaeota archaeon RBG_16_62_10]|nr:MAG: cobalt ECF transporter T component CbiQ [Euryarchaeota archaeon RBG_16_62_10]